MMNEITFEYETTVKKAFQMCGFDPQFVLSHPSDFKVIWVPDVVEIYYYKKKLLFSVFQGWDAMQNTTKYHVVFHHEKDEQKNP